MARTTSAKVQSILVTNYQYDGTTDLTPFMDMAGVITDRVKTCSDAEKSPLTETELEMVERLLSAHFYKHADQALESKNTDGASAKFQAKTDLYLASTSFGQDSMLLDFTG